LCQIAAISGSVPPTHVRPRCYSHDTCDGPEDVIRTLKRQVAASALLAALLCVAVAAASAAPPISARQAEAQHVLAQLQQLDSAAQVANSRYQQATARLQLLKQQLAQNAQALGVVRGNLVSAQKALAQRLVAIYTSQDSQSSLAVILGAQSLNDLVNRLETLNTVTTQDSSLIRQVAAYEHSIVRHRQLLHNARRSLGRLVRERAAAKHATDAKLAAEQRLYNSVRAQIAQLQYEQRASQLAAARQAQEAALAQETQSSIGGGITDGNLPPERYSAAVGIAEKYLGVPYVWGGASPSGFDCSGLVMYVYAQLGVSLPHYTVSQYNYANSVYVPRSQLEPGDLVFFAGLGHVGIYIGNNEFIHAPHTGAVVSIDSLTGWYSSEYYGAKRILG
jgi:cell wall-associated NlpC family hydrolase/type II secretory pathway pseudopilin PulG